MWRAHPSAASVAAALVIFALFVPAGATARPSSETRPAPRKTKDYVRKADQTRDARKLYEFESGAYLITTDVDKDLANDIAAHMDAVYREYDRRFSGFKPNPHAAVRPGERMPLYVLRRYKDYVNVLRDFGVNGENSGGVFFRTADRRSGLATWVEGQSRLRMYDVLQHEGFHQFADARIMVGLPPWVNEGIAEYFGEAVMVDGRLRIGRLDRGRLDRVRRAAKAGDTPKFAELMTMTNDAWVRRVNDGDKSASLLYDSAWSVCYFLIHGGNRGGPIVAPLRGERGPVLEGYLRILNQEFVRNPAKNPGPAAYKEVFNNNHKEFEKAWKAGLDKLEPDPWFSSVRHAQFIAAGMRLLHDKQVGMTDWAGVRDQLGRIKFRLVPRERDAAAQRGRKRQVEEVQTGYDFPAPAEAELVPPENPKLPPGLRITNVTPNILLSWDVDDAGEVREQIHFVAPLPPQPKKPMPVVAK